MDAARHSSDSIEFKLDQAWRQERRFVHVRGASRFMVWLIAMIVVDFIIDWGFLSRAGGSGNRLGLLLLVVNLGVLGWALWNEWLQHLKPYDPVLVALDVEDKHPELASVLVSYIQFKEGTGNQPNVSADLISTMRSQAVEFTRPLDFREIVDFSQLKKLVMVAGCVLLFFGIISISWSDHFKTLYQRLAGFDSPYPTQTRIDLDRITGDIMVRMGDTAIVSVRPTGVIPESGEIFTKNAAGKSKWRPLPMKKNSSTLEFRREINEVTSDLLYYVQLGDARSEMYRIQVIASPRVTESVITFEYPDYMGKAEETSDQLNLEVPEGTRLSWNLTCDPPVQDFQVLVDEASIDTVIDETGTRLSFGSIADRSFKYTFRWTEATSGKKFEYDDVQYNVRVIDDAIPEIQLHRPSASGLATMEKTVNIFGHARDDHGLGEAWLVYSFDGSAEERIKFHDFAGSPSGEFAYKWLLADSIKGLKPDSQLTFAVEVCDQHPDSITRMRRSPERRLTIVEAEQYLEWYLAELAAQQEVMKGARDSEQFSSEKVKQIKNQEDKSQ